MVFLNLSLLFFSYFAMMSFLKTYSQQKPMKLHERSNLLTTSFIPKSLICTDFHHLPSLQRTRCEFIYLVSPPPSTVFIFLPVTDFDL